ncbi:MAG: amidohydrolase family protein, partial [Cyclobacteriaceae bacterium]|nr:amidohydrolase family protein [Cyclobacteriaceae bacterium]
MKRILVLFLITTLFAGCAGKKNPADMIIRGGKIYTMNLQQPEVEAVAVAGGRIVYAGDAMGVIAFEGQNTRSIDLKGRTMTPGLIEGHGHFMGLGYSELDLDLMSVKSYEEMVEAVKLAVAKTEPGQWIIGRGWHQDKWTKKPGKMIKGFQTHELLSAASPNNPVFLKHASGHAGFANTNAMQLAGVNQLSVEKLSKEMNEGGEIIRDELGNPTGVFNERAQSLITNQIPDETEERDARAMDLAMQACLRNG